MGRPSKSATMRKADDELKKSLQLLGFTEHEAKAYISLCDFSPATAYEIAQRSGLPRSNVYNVLGALATKGAVPQVMRDPVKYVPIDASDFFGRQAKETATLCTNVADALKTRAQKHESDFVWAYSGEQAVHEKINELIQAANRNIWIKGPSDLIKNHLPHLKAAAIRGVNVILIIFGEDDDSLRVHPNIKVFLHEGRGANRGASHVVLTLTSDGSSFIIASFTDPVTASYARNASIVYVVETMILHEIYLAEMYSKIGPALDSMFGEHLGLLRNKYRPKTMGLSMLQSGPVPISQESSAVTPKSKKIAAKSTKPTKRVSVK